MTQISNFKKIAGQLPNNIFAGFVVSLVAMPLGLGLALASGAPPISGVISAIVGGIIVSLIGGSHVSITGPGNGLVVVVLTAITALGAGNMQEGFLHTLAAIICSGAILILLAFANLGKLSEFFPSSAIQGLLAAIGIIILAKQFHIMLGNMEAKGTTIELLMNIPKALINGFSNSYTLPAAIAGVASLLIMVFYAKIRNRYFQLIPAPMWIVVLSVGMAYIFENHIGVAHPIPAPFFVQIPSDVFSSFPRPNFSKAFSGDFIFAVVGITMIASIESLLSIKAVDKLDPLRRRSNVNKDLRALGIATIVSGFLGGLNVVTVIARSSVNVNNNGSNRSANFFQAAFLIVFILLFKKQLQHIPYPALAAILVYTGYKLASPTIVKKISEIGREQLFIFFVTLIATLFTGIVMGIVIGILATFITHLYLARGFKLFLDNFKHNNIVSAIEEDGKWYITVQHFCSFLNFYKLKKILDTIATNQTVVVDFLQCKFVDHTVMENMLDYEQTFDQNAGQFELIGLDLHNAESKHPSALRRVLKYVHFVPDTTKMSNRQRLLAAYCADLNWSFDAGRNYHLFFLNGFQYFHAKQVNHLYNIAYSANRQIKFFDIEYSEGAFIAEEQLHASMVYIKCSFKVPSFTLSKGDLYERFHYLGAYKEIKLKSFRDFAQRFSLRGNSLRAIRRFFDDEIILFFESNNYYHVESNGQGGLLIMGKERQSGVGEAKAMIDFALRLEAVIQHELPLIKNEAAIL